MSSIYIVQQGMGINDVVLNATGSLINLNAVLDANSFTDWTPTLTIGQQIIIPDTVTKDLNVVGQLATYPAVNNLTASILSSINTIFDTLPLWILYTSYWNDSGLWVDTAFWID